MNAVELEDSLFQSPLRTADDKQYIENLSLKLAHRNARHSGLELFDVWSTFYENNISETLKSFKASVENAPTIDRVAIIRRTIKRIKLNRESLEVIILLNDTGVAGNQSFGAGRAAGGPHGNIEPRTPLQGTGLDTTETLSNHGSIEISLIYPFNFIKEKARSARGRSRRSEDVTATGLVVREGARQP